MSTLQISLAVLGIVFLGMVLAYNTWAYRKAAPKRAAPPTPPVTQAPRQEPDLEGVDITHGQPFPPLPTTQDDPVLQASPWADANAEHLPDIHLDVAVDMEPAHSHSHSHTQPPPHAPGAESHPAHAASSAHTASDAGLPPADKRAVLNAWIDALALLRLDHPTPGDTILQVQPTTRRAGSKPFQVEGRNQSSGLWEPVRAGQRYTHLQAGVQLANRLGALNEIEFSEFALKVQTFADSLGAVLELPDMLHEVARARELDQFASQHDAQLRFMLRPLRAAWSPGYIAQQAAALGFVSSSRPGRMLLAAPHAGQPPLLTLAFDAQAAQAEDLDRTAVYELHLSLDVPQVAREQAPFERLCSVLHTLSAQMDGALCDPDGAVLPPEMLGQIAADLNGLYDTLQAHQLAAGSPLARRLFS